MVSGLASLILSSTFSVSAHVDPCTTSTVSLNNSYIVHPGHPNTIASGSASCTGAGVARSDDGNGRTVGAAVTYTWNITKVSADVSI